MNKKWMAWVGGCFLTLCSLFVGCSSDPADATATQGALEGNFTFTLELPAGVESQFVALAATNGMNLADRVKVRTPTGALSTITNTGTPTTEVGADAIVGNVYARGNVFLRSRSIVDGEVVAEGTVSGQDGVIIVGGIAQNPEIDPVSRPAWTVSIPVASAGDVMLEPDQQRTITPGRYGAVSVKSRAVLRLSSGQYFFRNLTIEPQGRVVYDQGAGAVEIYIEEVFTYRGAIEEAQGRSPQLILGIMGTADNHVEAAFNGVIVAPTSFLKLGTVAAGHRGAFFAKRIRVDPDTVIQHRPFIIPTGGVPTPTVPPVRNLPPPLLSASAHCGGRRGLAVSAWPMRSFCPAHIGFSPFQGARDNALVWRYRSQNAVRGQVTIAPGGNVYFGSGDGTFYSLKESGQVRWTFAAGSPVASTAAIGRDDSVYFGTDAGLIFALDARGNERWRFDSAAAFGDPGADNSVRSSPVVNDAGTIFVGASSGVVMALNANGSQRWVAEIGVPVTSSPALDGSTRVVVGTEGRGVVALNQLNGQVLWQRQDLGNVSSSPALSLTPRTGASGAAGTVYVGAQNGTLYALDLATGANVWTRATGGAVSSSPALNPLGQVFVGSEAGTVTALRPDGQVLWTHTVGSPVRSSPAIGADGIVYIGTDASTVLALNPTDGAAIWTFAAEAAVRAPPSIASSGRVIVGAENGTVYAIGADSSIHTGPPRGRPDAGPFTDPWGHPYDPSVTGSPGGFGNRDAGIPLVPQVSNDLPGGPATNAGGHETCGTGTRGLAGLDYNPSTRELFFAPNAPGGPPGVDCRLRFCREEAGTEVEIPLTLADLNRNPTDTPGSPLECGPSDPAAHCPIDPRTLGQDCTVDAQCNQGAGEICALSCDDVTCQNPRYRCGKRKETCDNVLPSQPSSSPFSEGDENSWPCADVRECAESLNPTVAFTGDPELQKEGSLNQEVTLDPNALRKPFPPPGSYPSYLTALNADPCNLSTVGEPGTLEQLDPRKGGSGNSKWGLFVEPTIQHTADVSPRPFFGDAGLSGSASASLIAGANIWGRRIEAMNAHVGGEIDQCTASVEKSLKIFEREYEVFGNLDNTQPPGVGDTFRCAIAVLQRGILANDLKKALYDAKAVFDHIRRHNGVQASLCARTQQVFGTTSCTADAVRNRWFQQYIDKANALSAHQFGELAAARAAVAVGGEVPLVEGSHQFSALGASFSYPVGPVTLTMEIEVAGDWGVEGSLDYKLVPVAPGSLDGPYVRVSVTPRAAVLAFAFVGAGIPGVSVGVLGELELLGVYVPLTTSFTTNRVSFNDVRPPSSSGLWNDPLQQPFGGAGEAQWSASWKYGAGLELNTLSGQIDLAVRVRLLFFKKTFRKKIADWKGLTQRFDFVGAFDLPFKADFMLGDFLVDVPFPPPTSPTVFDGSVLGPDIPPIQLGPRDFPGICGTPLPECIPNNLLCTTSQDCCSRNCVPDPASGASFCRQRPPQVF